MKNHREDYDNTPHKNYFKKCYVRPEERKDSYSSTGDPEIDLDRNGKPVIFPIHTKNNTDKTKNNISETLELDEDENDLE